MLASRDYDRRFNNSQNKMEGNNIKLFNYNIQIEILTPLRKESGTAGSPKYKISTNPHTNSFKNFEYVKRPNNYLYQNYSSENLLSKGNNQNFPSNRNILYKNKNKNKINNNKVNIATVYSNTANNSSKKNELLFCVPPNIISYSNIIGNINYSQNNTYNENLINSRNNKNNFNIYNKKNEVISGTENHIKLAGMPNMISSGLNEVYRRVKIPNRISKYIIKNHEKDEEEESSVEKNVVVLPCSRYKGSRKGSDGYLQTSDNIKNNIYNQCSSQYGNQFIYDDKIYNDNDDNDNENNNRNYFFRMEKHRRNRFNNFMNYWYDSDNHSGGKVNLSLNNPCQKYKTNFYLSIYKIIRIQSVWRGFFMRQMLSKKGAARKNIFYRKKYFIKTIIDSIRNYLKRNFVLFIQILRNMLKKNYIANPNNLISSNYYNQYNKINDDNKLLSDLYRNDLDENRPKNCFASPLKFYVPEKVNNIRMKGTPNNQKQMMNFSENKLIINRNLNKLSIIDDVKKELKETQHNRFTFKNISPNKSSQFSISKPILVNKLNRINSMNDVINNFTPYQESDGSVCKGVTENTGNKKLNSNDAFLSNGDMSQNDDINDSNNKINSNEKLNINISTNIPKSKNVYSKKLQKSYTNKNISPSKKLFDTFNNKNQDLKYDSQDGEDALSQLSPNQEDSGYMGHIDNESRYHRFNNVKIQKPRNYTNKNEKYKKYLYFCYILPDKIKKICIKKYFQNFHDGLLLRLKSNNEILKQKLLTKIIINNTKKNLENFFKFYKEQILTEKIREKIFQNQVNTSQNQSLNHSMDNNNHFSFLQNSVSSHSNNNLIIARNNNIAIVKNDKNNKKKKRESILCSLVVKRDDKRTKYFYKWKKMIIRLIKAKRHVKVKYFGSSNSKSKSKSKDLQRSVSSKRGKNSPSPYKKMNVKKKYTGNKKEIDMYLYKKLINILKMTDHIGLKNYFYAWKGKKQFGYNRKKFLIYFIMNIKEYFYSDVSVKGNEEYLLGKTMFIWYRKACH